MSTQKMLILRNPNAGGNDNQRLDQLLQETLTPAGIAYRVDEITHESDLHAIVAEAVAEGKTLIVASGGDGTVSAVANAVVDHSIPLAILPCGTANLLARALRIPLQLENAVQLLLQHNHYVQIDIMRRGSETFVSHVSLGTYAQIAKRTATDETAKRNYGRLLYIWHALLELRQQKSWPFHITVDGKTDQFRASLVLCANIGAVGIGDWQWGEQISPTDGLINLAIVRARSGADYLSLFWHMARHQTQQAPTIRYLQARQSIQISTPYPLAVRGDGEIIGQSSVRLDLLSQAIRVLVPYDKAD